MSKTNNGEDCKYWGDCGKEGIVRVYTQESMFPEIIDEEIVLKIDKEK